MKNIREIKIDFENVFAEVSAIQGLSASDKVQVAIAALQELGKYSRGEAMSTAKANGNGNQVMPATDKQKNALSKFGVKFSDTITKSEASDLLDKAITEAQNKKGR